MVVVAIVIVRGFIRGFSSGSGCDSDSERVYYRVSHRWYAQGLHIRMVTGHLCPHRDEAGKATREGVWRQDCYCYCCCCSCRY